MIDRRQFLQICAFSTATEAGLPAERQIKVIGVGSCGSNAVHYMIASGVKSVQYICADTGADAQNRCLNHKNIQLHRHRQPMRAKLDWCRITSELVDAGFRSSIEGTDTLYLVTGMGGRTGTQVAPEMARISRSMGIRTFAVVTTPFEYEIGRTRYAGLGLAKLRTNVDSLIVLSNDKLLELLGDDVTQDDVFAYGYDLMRTAIVGIN